MPDFATVQYWQVLLFKSIFFLVKALLAFLQRDSFIYWPFLISTVVIGALAWRYGYARGNVSGTATWREFFQRYLGKSLWWHPSARLDYRFYFVNAIIYPLLMTPFLFGENTAGKWLDNLFGSAASSVASDGNTTGLATRIAYTLLFFIAYDFGRFVAHCLLHDVPVLWEFHKVHHSAEVLTPMTSFRAHPVDLAVVAWGSALATGVMAWLFHRFVDNSVGIYTFLGLHVLFWVGNLIGNLRHWQVWLSYGAALNRWLISPAHHQLHHSAELQHRGCNRGFEIAVWDRLYGTLRVPSNQPETFKMGLGDETDGQWRSVGRLYLWPFTLAFKRLFSAQKSQPDTSITKQDS
jgi:sterol desaturase/sphingolipid hydroxylase (fatty acid hydroxylase superfamily)